jgi:archaellum component FlaC
MSDIKTKKLEQMKILNEQDDILNKLSNRVDGIKEITKEISYTLDESNNDLEKLITKINVSKKNIKTANKKISRLENETPPCNCFGFVFVLSLWRFFY